MSWINKKERLPDKDGEYWCYYKSKRKLKSIIKLKFENGKFEKPLMRIKAWTESEQMPDSLPPQNKMPKTNDEIKFKRMEMIGDAAIPCIVTQYYIANGYKRALIPPIVNIAKSNRILAVAAKNAGLSAPFESVITKSYGSAFEYETGRILVEEGYEKAYQFINKWLIPVMIKNVNLDEIESKIRKRSKYYNPT